MQRDINTQTQRHLKRSHPADGDEHQAAAVGKAMKITNYFTNCSKKTEEHEDSQSLSVGKDLSRIQPLDKFNWRIIKGENLKLRYSLLYSKADARNLLEKCEQELVYNTGDLAKVKIFGKLIDIPRKQVAHGDAGLSYTFSGNTVPAMPWTPLLNEIRSQVSKAAGYDFNFVLINRYKDGHDYMGEHKDDEKDLCQGYPIASLSLGQPRDFVFKHQDSRGSLKKQKNQSQGGVKVLKPVTIQLEHGSLLLMEHPTNSYWYHSLPRRTRALGLRLNMTFRQMNPAQCKPVPGYT